MKRLLPTGAELAMFAGLAFICSAVALLASKYDLVMAVFALPIFVVAAWMGMRRSGQWDAIAPVVKPLVDAEEETVV